MIEASKINRRMHPPMHHTYNTNPSQLKWLYLPWKILGVLMALGFFFCLFM